MSRYCRPPDEAWEKDNHRTNAKLVDGMKVQLKHATTLGPYRPDVVPAGTQGVVIHARTPRVCGPGVYFANVDVTLNNKTERVRVPHSALRILNTKGKAK